jgi:hypothetical protein
MRKVLTTTLAIAALSVLGSHAMAQTHHNRTVTNRTVTQPRHYRTATPQRHYRRVAQPRQYQGNWMAAAPYQRNWMAAAPPAAPATPFNFSNPLDAYDVGDTPMPFGGARPQGSAVNTPSQPYYNPALDRAKGNID